MRHGCGSAMRLRRAPTAPAAAAAAASGAASTAPLRRRQPGCSITQIARGGRRVPVWVAFAGRQGAGADSSSGKQKQAAAGADAADEGDEGEGDEGEWDAYDADAGGEGEWDEDDDEAGEWDEGDEWEEGDDEWEEGEEEMEGEEDEDEDDEGDSARPRPPMIPADATVVPYVEGQFVEVGRVTRAFGIRGELKVAPLTDEPRKRFARGKRLWLQPPAGRRGGAGGGGAGAGGGAMQQQRSQSRSQQQHQPPPLPAGALRRVVVEAARVVKPEAKGKPGSEAWGLKLAEVGDRGAAEALAGHTLLLAVCDRERLRRGGDEFFIQDLIGLKVRCDGGDCCDGGGGGDVTVW